MNKESQQLVSKNLDYRPSTSLNSIEIFDKYK